MSLSTDLLINKRLGRYEIRERIGVGGMARVFKAWDTNLDRTVAIKVLHEHLVDDPTFKDRFEREAKLVAGLNHPNIVKIYDYSMVELGEQVISYMVMPYIPGNTLKDVLDDLNSRSERMDRQQVLSIMLSLTNALSYAHAAGMVHRDVKPGNILFDEHGHAVLTDFGIARLKEGANLTQDGATVGTPTYLSPEQAAGMPVDARSDLYALGVILFELLTGQPPFVDENSISIILKHLHTPVPSVTDYTTTDEPALESFIFKALAKKPQERFQTAQEFARDLSQVFNTEPAPQLNTRLLTREYSPTPDLPSTQHLTPTSTPLFVPTHFAPVPVPASSRSPLTLVALVTALAALTVALALLITQRPGQASDNLTPSAEFHVSSMTANESPYFVGTFAENDKYRSKWQQTQQGTTLRQITPDGFYHIENRDTNTAITSMFDPGAIYQDATITLAGALAETSARNSGYGIVFRYQNEQNYYVFAVDGAERFSLWQLKDGTWDELRDQQENWSVSEFVNPMGETNQLTITFASNHLVGSVNQSVVVDVYLPEKTPVTGAIGIYLATPNNGTATVLIDTVEVRSEVPSMTVNEP